MSPEQARELLVLLRAIVAMVEVGAAAIVCIAATILVFVVLAVRDEGRR